MILSFLLDYPVFHRSPPPRCSSKFEEMVARNEETFKSKSWLTRWAVKTILSSNSVAPETPQTETDAM